MHRTAWRRTAAALALAVVPVLSACSVGVDASTSVQGASGNGANASVGSIQLRGITVVTSADATAGSPTTASVIGSIVNTGGTDDALTGVSVVSPQGATAALNGAAVSGGQLPVPALQSVRVGFNADDYVIVSNLTSAPSTFADVQLTFQNAGIVVVPAMVVPPTGIYTGLGPFTG